MSDGTLLIASDRISELDWAKRREITCLWNKLWKRYHELASRMIATRDSNALRTLILSPPSASPVFS